MQPLKLQRVKAVLLVLALAPLFQGCGWQRTMTFPSPSRKEAIEVWQKGIANEYGIRVEFVGGQGRTVLHEKRGEAIIYFVHVAWSQDETRVGILGTGSHIFGVGFDARNRMEIPFETVRADLAQSIAETYNVPMGSDPIEWATSSEAGIAFWKAHPEIRLSYRPGKP